MGRCKQLHQLLRLRRLLPLLVAWQQCGWGWHATCSCTAWWRPLLHQACTAAWLLLLLLLLLLLQPWGGPAGRPPAFR
jgi:hypothetical protein